MFESTQFAAEYAALPGGSFAPAFTAAELERQQMSVCLAALHRRLRMERRIRSLQSFISFWPVIVGVALGTCAPFLRDLAANGAPSAVALLFPFSALAAASGLHLSWDAAQALGQFLIYAQFPLEGLLVRIVLKHRVGLFKVFGQVACIHVLAVLYLALVSGSLAQLLAH